MISSIRRLGEEIRALKSQLSRRVDYAKHVNDPCGYAANILGVKLTPRQEEILRAVLEPPYRILVPSGHDVGKTFCGAVLVSWWFDTRNPSVCLTTAPKLEQVKDLLWKEIRSQRGKRGLSGFSGPKSLRLESSPRHFAKGITANTQAGFQGQHEKNVLIVIDEAEGVDREYFEAAKTMASGEGHAIVCFYNPYTSTSHVAQEEQATDKDGNPSWRILPMSSLDHPNIGHELVGEDPAFPQALRLAKVEQWLQDWCQRIDEVDAKPTDIAWPVLPDRWLEKRVNLLVGMTQGTMALEGQGLSGSQLEILKRECRERIRLKLGPVTWYRPGPRFEAGALGRRPTQAVDSVWSVALIDKCIKNQLPITAPLQIGVDVARFGDDYTTIHIRAGGCSLYHEALNGWSTTESAQRVNQLACEWGSRFGVPGNSIVVAVDICGVGGGVADRLRELGMSNVADVNSSVTIPENDKHDNIRSALWFDLAEEATKGNVDFSRLTREQQQTLRREFPSQQYKLDVRGRRCCLPKAMVKQQLGRSPDNADAVNLAYFNVNCIPDRVSGRVAMPGG